MRDFLADLIATEEHRQGKPYGETGHCGECDAELHRQAVAENPEAYPIFSTDPPNDLVEGQSWYQMLDEPIRSRRRRWRG